MNKTSERMRHRFCLRKLFSLFFAMGLCLLCAGCLQARSLDTYGYVVCIGVDKSEQPPFDVTFAVQKIGGQEESPQSQGFTLATVGCTNLFEAMDLASGTLPYELNLSRTQMIVIGESLAQSGAWSEFLDISSDTLHLRHDADLIIAKDKAMDFIAGLKNSIEPVIDKIRFDFLQDTATLGYIPTCNLFRCEEALLGQYFDPVIPYGAFSENVTDDAQLSKAMQEGKKISELSESDQQGGTQSGQNGQSGQDAQAASGLLMPQTNLDSVSISPTHEYHYTPEQLPRQGGLKSVLMGSALFDGKKMVGYLDGQHTQLLLMALDEFERGRIYMNDPDGQVMSVLLLRRNAAKHQLTLGDEPKAEIKIDLEVMIEMPSSIVGKDSTQLTRYIADFLERELEAVFASCQSLNADAFGLGKLAAKQLKSIGQWESFSFKERYPHIDMTFDVAVRLTETLTEIK